MADPVIVACPADAWTKVATNVTSGQVHIKNYNPANYLQTYRDTGGTAPTDPEEGVQVSGQSIPIAATAGIDVYIMAQGAVGSVRVDLP